MSNESKIDNIIKKVDNQTYRLTVIGSSGSGKSTFVYKLLETERKTKYSKMTIIVVFTPIFNAEKYRPYANIIHTGTSNLELTENLIKLLEIAGNKEMKEKYRFIVVFDDVISEKFIQTDLFREFFVTARHYDMNIIFVIQAYHVLISSLIKDNTTHYLIFKMNSVRTQKELIRELIANTIGDVEKTEKENTSKATELYKTYVLKRKYGNILINMIDFKIYI